MTTIERMAKAQHAARGHVIPYDELDIGHRRLLVEAMKAAVAAIPDSLIYEALNYGSCKQDFVDARSSLLDEQRHADVTRPLPKLELVNA